MTKTISLEKGIWTNLYEESGFSIGSKLNIQVVGGKYPTFLSDSENTPVEEDGYTLALKGEWYTNRTTDLGAWAKSQDDAKITVQLSDSGS